MSSIADTTDARTVEELTTAVTELQEIVSAQAEQIEKLEREIEVQSSNVAGAHNRIGKVENRVESADTGVSKPEEGGSGDATPTPNGDETGTQPDATPLDQLVALPEHVAEKELSANQERARFIARDIRDYAEKVPAGLLVDSSTIKKVLTAAEGSKPHTQTVARVMDFLGDLGKDGVKLKKRRGRKLVVFDPEVADRLANHGRCDRGSADTHASSVIGSA